MKRRIIIVKASEDMPTPAPIYGKRGKPVDVSAIPQRGNPVDYPGRNVVQSEFQPGHERGPDGFLRSDLHRFSRRLVDRMSTAGRSDEIISPDKFHNMALTSGVHPHELALAKAHKEQMTGHAGFTASGWSDHIDEHGPIFTNVLHSEHGRQYPEYSFGTKHSPSKYREFQLKLLLPKGTHTFNQKEGHFHDPYFSPDDMVNLWHARDIMHHGTTIGDVAALQEGQYDEAQGYNKKMSHAEQAWRGENSDDTSAVQPVPLQHIVHTGLDERPPEANVMNAARKADDEGKPWLQLGAESFHEPILGAVSGRNQPNWEHEYFMPWYIAKAVHDGADAVMLPNEEWKNGDYGASDGDHVRAKHDAWLKFLTEAQSIYGGELKRHTVSNISQDGDRLLDDAYFDEMRDLIDENRWNDHNLSVGFAQLDDLASHPILWSLANAHKTMNDRVKQLPDAIKSAIQPQLEQGSVYVHAKDEEGNPIRLTSGYRNDDHANVDGALRLPLPYYLDDKQNEGIGRHSDLVGASPAEERLRWFNGDHPQRSDLFRHWNPETDDLNYHYPDADYMSRHSSEVNVATQRLRRHHEDLGRGDDPSGIQISVEPHPDVKNLLQQNGLDPELLSWGMAEPQQYDSNDYGSWPHPSGPKHHFNEFLSDADGQQRMEPPEATGSGDGDYRWTWILPDRLKQLLRQHGISPFAGRKAFMNLEKHLGNVVKSIFPEDVIPRRRIVVLPTGLIKAKSPQASSPLQTRRDMTTGTEYAVFNPQAWQDAMSTSGSSRLGDNADFRRLFGRVANIDPGQRVGVRLNINFLNNFGVPLQSVHSARTKNPWGETVLAYNHAVTLEDPSFDVHQKSAYEIASGQKTKHPMAAVVGRYVPVDDHGHLVGGPQVGFNPRNYHLFVDMTTGKPVKSAKGRVTIYGTRVYMHPGTELEYWGEDAPKPYMPTSKALPVDWSTFDAFDRAWEMQ